MRDFGIRMEGCEDAIEAIVKEACGRFDPFRYLEIGVGGGGTLKAVTEIARENKKLWYTVGVDLPDGWSLSIPEIKQRIPDITIVSDANDVLNYSGPNLVLQASQLFCHKWDSIVPFHAVLIDGCHGKACVMADFLGVEPLVEKGGFVIFHDAGIDEQGVDMQPHCGEPINVRSALEELKLLPSWFGRDGWKFWSEIPGDEARGGHSCVVVQKV